jgi:hypothetical protein
LFELVDSCFSLTQLLEDVQRVLSVKIDEEDTKTLEIISEDFKTLRKIWNKVRQRPAQETLSGRFYSGFFFPGCFQDFLEFFEIFLKFSWNFLELSGIFLFFFLVRKDVWHCLFTFFACLFFLYLFVKTKTRVSLGRDQLRF